MEESRNNEKRSKSVIDFVSPSIRLNTVGVRTAEFVSLNEIKTTTSFFNYHYVLKGHHLLSSKR